jgi:capsular polysaccharide biosynthesis protein
MADSAREFLAAGHVPDALGQQGEGSFTMPARIDRRVSGPCLLLKRPWSRNFGHWLIDQASVLSLLVRTGQLPSRRLVVARLGSRGLGNVMRETVSAILPEAELLEHPNREVWQFDSLAYAMPVHVPTSFKLPDALDSLHRHLLSAAAPPGDRPRRLHLVRAAGGSRALDNETELLAISARHGFVPIQPERLPLAEQVALFAGAEAVIGVKGAGLTAILFAEPACSLIVLSPASFIDVVPWNIAGLRGHPFWELYGPVTRDRGDPGHHDFRIDPAKFETMLQRALAGRGAVRASPVRAGLSRLAGYLRRAGEGPVR